MAERQADRLRIVWLPVAERNLNDQLAYIDERNARAGADMAGMVATAVGHLADFPQIGRSGRIDGTREIVVTGTPYVIAYLVEPDTVVILRVLHSSQRWTAHI